MSAQTLLSALSGVRETGPGRWLAKCAAHDDPSPSLSVRELADGRVLVHCFAECAVEEVLRAVNLKFSDLYPESQLGDHIPRERHPFPADDILRVLATEADFVATVAANLETGIDLTDADRNRLRVAANRIRSALEASR